MSQMPPGSIVSQVFLQTEVLFMEKVIFGPKDWVCILKIVQIVLVKLNKKYWVCKMLTVNR